MHLPILSASVLRDTLCVGHTRAQSQECSCMRFCMAASLSSCRVFRPTGVWHQRPAALPCTLNFLQVSSALAHGMYCSVFLRGMLCNCVSCAAFACKAAFARFVVRDESRQGMRLCSAFASAAMLCTACRAAL